MLCSRAATLLKVRIVRAVKLGTSEKLRKTSNPPHLKPYHIQHEHVPTMSLPGMLPPGMAGGQQNTGGMSDQEMKMVKAVRPPSRGPPGGHVQSLCAPLAGSRMETMNSD